LLLFSFDSQIKILDWGCGNGRFYPLFKDCLYYGVDISEKLINLAKQKYPSAIFSLLHSPLSLPFDNNFFDEIICLAVSITFLLKNFVSNFCKKLGVF